MLGWLHPRRRGAAPPPPPQATPVNPAPAPADDTSPVDEPGPSALSWLLDGPQALEVAPLPLERQLLQALDQRLAAAATPAELLPRAAAVIPQLMAQLRQVAPQRSALVQQVLKDLVLTAEVLRLARSPFYGAQPVDTLEAALDRIGTAGLHSAMARVVLKPMFQPSGSGLAARAAPRLWQHAEYKSLLCADLVARGGGDRFEGFLAGLLHDTGWMALLRVMDRAGLQPKLPMSRALEAALDRRKDWLFGRLAADWDLNPALTSLGRQLQSSPVDALAMPLAEALRTADRTSIADLAGQPASAPA